MSNWRDLYLGEGSPVVPSPTSGAPATAPTTTPPPTPTPTTVVPVPTQPLADSPFFDGGDYVAIVAVLIAFAAAWFAQRAARANEDMVIEQRKANDLHADELSMARQHRQEDLDRQTTAIAAAAAEQEADARAEAARVTVQYVYNAAIDVVITNDSRAMIRDVRLVDFKGEHPDWTWRPNPAIPLGNSPAAARLAVGDKKIVNCVFFDERGTQQRTDGQRYHSLVRFTDLNGQRWERSEESGLRKVVPDDSDLAPPET